MKGLPVPALGRNSPAEIFVFAAIAVPKFDNAGLLHFDETALQSFPLLSLAVPLLLVALLILSKRFGRARQTPQQSGKNFDTILEWTPTAICITESTDGHCVYANRTACELFGLSFGEHSQINLNAAIAENCAAQQLCLDALTSGDIARNTLTLKRKDGSLLTVDVSVRMIDDGRFVWCFSDVTEHKRTEEELRNQIRFADDLIKSLPGIFYLADKNGRFLRWNANFEAVSGYSAGELERAHPLDFVSEADKCALVGDNVIEMFTSERPPAESYFLTKDRRRIPFFFTSTKAKLGQDDCLLGVGLDITSRKTAEEQIYYLAHYDALTNLPNRILFNDRINCTLSLASRYGQQFAVLFVDLDCFKKINDTHGHCVGDIVLKQTAHRIALSLRDSDTVARIGGDEFLVLLPGIAGTEEACIVAEKILTAVARPLEADGTEITVSSSIGIAIYPIHGTDNHSLIKAADEAMYHAKRTGKNRYHIKKNMPSFSNAANKLYRHC
ncbi:sensor domain-containing diguanylate cyclase [Methylocaldum szegediense]|uniref:PAS domain S-box-containing protein/diguanylate cyclase (GGDEF)-like protein n=1 Tax=Methylocaldum szegediense TaxID=73780 RepID=A0ABM9I543_9GAMM|nr:sensor domain-containing diguanylate cyclase [Methylocaldum szegediense]CAI8898199.1 PAS domain S-box-containing protein/diguanylate cyclase (GGDEF)-like protein [Methylocaldum szegediense]